MSLSARCTTTSRRRSISSRRCSIKWAATLRSSLARHPPQGLTPREKLTEALHRSVRAFQHQPQLARLIASLELSSDPFATEILERMDQTTSSVVHGIARRCGASSGPHDRPDGGCRPRQPVACMVRRSSAHHRCLRLSQREHRPHLRRTIPRSRTLILMTAAEVAQPAASDGADDDGIDAATDVLGARRSSGQGTAGGPGGIRRPRPVVDPNPAPRRSGGDRRCALSSGGQSRTPSSPGSCQRRSKPWCSWSRWHGSAPSRTH